ncbi:Bug family tripartite tricarboxylate transporter substrate binding protein [Ottowia thiooxydans]|uniref:Bug family tripartite tricarboxylate transporter substrate binding protein n=1 Tax=Ottowia thiooxydans TaxID=219182 RepID=UPI000414D8A5|nr:tripartite tricarboxylate transporter substrate binding protein [Ottowia thiooxydans]
MFFDSKQRRQVLQASIALALGVAAGSVQAQAKYPDHPIRLQVGFAPGTGPDILARTLARGMSTQLNQQVVVENRTGAGGQIAAANVAKGPKDGYNLLLADVSAISIAPFAFSKIGYEPTKELVPLSEVAKTDFVLVVPNSSVAKDAPSFMKMATAKGGKVDFGTFGAGSPGHFGAVILGQLGSFPLEAVHYRQTGDAVTATIAGQIDGILMSTPLAMAQIKGAKVKGLATTAPKRSPLLPDVATFAEQGYPKADFSAWFTVFAPTGTPEPILQLLSEKVAAAVRDPEINKTLVEAGFSVTGTSRDEVTRMIAADMPRWKAVVEASGFRGVD